MQIDRLINIDKIWNLQHEFERNNGIKILNVSDWNCSRQFKDTLLDVFDSPTYNNFVEYIYSYSLSESIIEQLRNKYPFCKKNAREVMITPNNTVSIIYIANLLKQLNLRKICVIAPSYFSIYNALDVFNINYDKLSLHRQGNQFQIDSNIEWNRYDAIWLTSPVFCNGVSFDSEILDTIERLSKEKIIVTDESFCQFGEELPNKINLKNHIGIYSPHKGIGFNAFKFSLISLNKEFMDILEQWSDVLCGSLNTVNYDAIQHFLSTNFNVCQKAYAQFINTSRENICKLIEHNKNLSYDTNSTGNMMMVYTSKYKNSDLCNDEFYKELMLNTRGCIFPGYLHDYDDSFGFCFRVNLSLYNEHFHNIFQNICNYMK